MSGDLTLVLLATGGTIALVSAAFLMGFNKFKAIDTEDQARALLWAYAPETVPQSVAIAQDNRFALIASLSGEVFLVRYLGDSPVVRRLLAADVSLDRSGALRIDAKDTGFPKLNLRFDLDQLKPILEALQKSKRHEPS